MIIHLWIKYANYLGTFYNIIDAIHKNVMLTSCKTLIHVSWCEKCEQMQV